MQLKGLERITLKAGEKKTIVFTVTPEMLSILNVDMHRVVARSEFDLGAPLRRQRLACCFGGEGARRVQDFNLAVPASCELIYLFLQRHTQQQVSHTILDGKTGVLVSRRVAGCSRFILGKRP